MNSAIKTKLALVYDFDKTLSPDDMQNYGFICALGQENDTFWETCNKISKGNRADRILSYMFAMVQQSKEANIKMTKEYLKNFGKEIKLFEGVEEWFERINKFGQEHNVEVEHYIVSSGVKEMIEGTSIADRFKKIFACSYIYDQDGNAIWPASAINYTNKTQFLYRINKGILDELDDSVNDIMDHSLRSIPFENMIYIGDSLTDIPCMRLVMKNGGNAIGVFGEDSKNKGYLKKLITDNRINYVVPANYLDGSEIDYIVKEIIKSARKFFELKLLTKQQKER